MSKEIIYKKGDATAPKGDTNKIIVHICNDIGGWGKGFVMAISNKWKLPEQEYRKWYASKVNFELGAVQYVNVENKLWIANLIGQHKINKDKSGNAPIRYESIRDGLKKISIKSKELNAVIHMPRIGCGLAGGEWSKIEKIINEELISKEITVVVYDFT